MLEQFTDRARRVVVLAQEEARSFNHNYIGTEHFLLGLVHEGEGVAVKAMDSLGVSLDHVRRRVEEVIGHGQIPATGHIPFTPRAKKVLELSKREATRLGHNYIGTEHILLGLLAEGEGVACQILVSLGVDLDKVRAEVVRLLSGDERGASPESRTATVTEHFSVSFRSESDPIHMPLCPSCRRSLEGNLRSRSLPVEGTSRVVFAVYCANCGVVIETRIEDPIT